MKQLVLKRLKGKFGLGYMDEKMLKNNIFKMDGYAVEEFPCVVYFREPS